MKKLVHYFESEKGKRLKNTLVCFGASVVLAGALFKIMHWPGAGAMLTAGMLTEVFLFAMFGILPPHSDYYWEKLYPGITLHPDHDPGFEHAAVTEKKGSVTEQLDTMMEDANITPDAISRLGDGLRKFSESTAALVEVNDASAATNEYIEQTRHATSALSGMSEAYVSATDSIQGLASSSEGTREYHEQIQKVAQNLSQLNSIYETELEDTANHARNLNQFFGTFSSSIENMSNSFSSSAEDATRLQNEMSSFTSNLSNLNAVYGNMLSAMGVGMPTNHQG